MNADAATPSRHIVGWVGLIAGPVLALLAYALIPPAVYDDAGTLVSGLPHAGRATAGVGALMACWWLTEAIDLAFTALVPVALLPLLGVVDVKQAAAPYANDLIFLFFGGFMLGLALERWNLHRRIALVTLNLVGDSPARLVAGFMITTALLSMWVSNTATALMMLPIGVSVIGLLERDGKLVAGHNFSVCLVLGIAYAASIGGVATLVGTPPNVVLAGYCHKTLGRDISMAHWMLAAVPLVLVFLPLCWLVLTRIVFPISVKHIPGAKEMVRDELRALGPMSRGEWAVAVVFILTATAWVTRPLIQQLGDHYEIDALSTLRDSSIAMLAALVLFVTPVYPSRREFTLDWATVRRTPWGVLILFGGGLSLAAAITATGVDTYIGRSLAGMHGVPTPVVVAAVAVVIIFLTEITSNTAVTTAVLPVLGAAAPALGVDPVKLVIPAAIAASFAFMLPVATPPNAIVFSSGRVSVPQMVRAGFLLNLIGIVLVSLAGLLVADFVAPATITP